LQEGKTVIFPFGRKRKREIEAKKMLKDYIFKLSPDGILEIPIDFIEGAVEESKKEQEKVETTRNTLKRIY
jgi:hypothetical protein